MLNKSKTGQSAGLKHMDVRKRKLTVWWIMVGSFSAVAIVGMALTGAGHSIYANSIGTTKTLRKQLDTLTAQKQKDVDGLKGLSGQELTKQQAKIYDDQKKIDEINSKLSNGVKTTELTYGVFLILLSLLLLAGIGLYSYGIFSKKEGVLYQKKTTLQ